MHKNPTITVKSLVERIQAAGLEVSKNQVLALIFMENKEFTHVQRTIDTKTRRQIKASFTQHLIDSLLVLENKTRERVEELVATEQLEQELIEDALPWQEGGYSWYDDINHAILPNNQQSTKPYRRDKKDLKTPSFIPNSQPKSPSPSLIATTSIKAIEKSSSEKQEERIDTLTDEQMEQLIRTGTLQSIKAVLRDETISLTKIQSDKLRIQMNILSHVSSLPDRKGTIEKREITKKIRSNQTAFRAKVLSEYGYECAITGIAIPAILEAAHVIPADGNNDRVDNSLLLSRNMHGLFDRFLISINSETDQLELAPTIRGKGLDQYQGKVIKHAISKQNLRWHYMQFKNKENK
ncbi:HNH endonuclease [Vibrio furnissii]|uniref:HNH endonuclease n=1 Tax=Vibrio furnissii TaxID=29494 RepID=UPI0013021333|nr:HNH endonuclease signature motif containing protein [Vibrio furnissii]MCG6212737.1 HNH endonuclease [Vibrio furnissii]